MPKTDKELAVELYSALITASAQVMSNPNFTGKVEIPTYEKACEDIERLMIKLERIK